MNTAHTLVFGPTMCRILKGFILSLLLVFISIAQSHKPASQHNMVLVVGGKFQMGDDHGYGMEQPVHPVTIKSFYIDKFEVTVKEFQRFCLETHRALPAEPAWGWHDDFPISNVSWDGAASYAAWAGKRLPTEAEWEFAARGGILSKG
jgi:formylglycine-generating enzyme